MPYFLAPKQNKYLILTMLALILLCPNSSFGFAGSEKLNVLVFNFSTLEGNNENPELSKTALEGFDDFFRRHLNSNDLVRQVYAYDRSLPNAWQEKEKSDEQLAKMFGIPFFIKGEFRLSKEKILLTVWWKSLIKNAERKTETRSLEFTPQQLSDLKSLDLSAEWMANKVAFDIANASGYLVNESNNNIQINSLCFSGFNSKGSNEKFTLNLPFYLKEAFEKKGFSPNFFKVRGLENYEYFSQCEDENPLDEFQNRILSPTPVRRIDLFGKISINSGRVKTKIFLKDLFTNETIPISDFSKTIKVKFIKERGTLDFSALLTDVSDIIASSIAMYTLQVKLKENKYYEGDFTGIPDRNTVKALFKFNRDERISPATHIGPKTYEKLGIKVIPGKFKKELK